MAKQKPGGSGTQGAAVEHISTIEWNDFGPLPIVQNVGVELRHDKPQKGQCIGGIQGYWPKKSTIGRRLTTCSAFKDMVKDRAAMTTVRQLTFREIRGDDGKTVSASISCSNCHLCNYWVETRRDDDGNDCLYEFIEFQPEGVTFG